MKRLLVICDDLWHPAEIVKQGFGYLADEKYTFDFVCDAKDILTSEMLSEYPMIFICKGNSINAANQNPWFEQGVTEVCPKELRDYVEKGGILVALHAGSAVHPDWFEEPKFKAPAQDYVDLIGCRFLGHPPRCAVTYSVVNPEHPIMDGVEDFTERDEHYQLDVTAEFVTTLFESSSETGGAGLPAGFLHVVGNGRVVVLTPGHNLAVWKNPNFQRILKNVMQYYLEQEE
ncbi:MAG: ThuA domain-containing protein [Firmicutes bacterium]|nr:ThuA domain-containing protein [Bacillota bacterium]